MSAHVDEAIRGYAIYPAARYDVVTLRRIRHIFPSLSGIVLVDGAYQRHKNLMRLFMELRTRGKLFSADLAVQPLLEESQNSKSYWISDRAVPFQVPMEISLHDPDHIPFQIYLYPNDYIVAPKGGDDATAPFLQRTELRKRFPAGFSVSVVCRPGYAGHLSQGDAGERWYGRMMAESAEPGFIYVSQADRPSNWVLRSGRLSLIYQSMPLDNQRSIPQGSFVIYQTTAKHEAASSNRSRPLLRSAPPILNRNPLTAA